MSRKRQGIVIVLVVLMMGVAGCTGWGTDSPTEPAEETDGDAETQDEVDENDSNDTGASQGDEADTTPTSDSGSPADSDSGSEDGSSSSGGEGDDPSGADAEARTADLRVYAEDRQAGGYLTGVEVTVENRETGETYTGTTHRGETYDGNYVIFESLPLGTYQITVAANGYEEATNVVQLTESGRQPILQMEPQEPELTITVVDQYGEPADRGEVSLTYGEYGVVDYRIENGQVDAVLPEDGTYQYAVTAEGYSQGETSGTIEVTGDTERTIQIEQTTYTLTVDVGQAGIPVTIERHADGATTTRETRSDGTVEFTVYPGNYTVHGENESSGISVEEDSTVVLDSR